MSIHGVERPEVGSRRKVHMTRETSTAESEWGLHARLSFGSEDRTSASSGRRQASRSSRCHRRWLVRMRFLLLLPSRVDTRSLFMRQFKDRPGPFSSTPTIDETHAVGSTLQNNCLRIDSQCQLRDGRRLVRTHNRPVEDWLSLRPRMHCSDDILIPTTRTRTSESLQAD